jgi:hypothetical protein
LVNGLFIGVNGLFPYLPERVGEVYRVFAHQVGYLDRGKDREGQGKDKGRTREEKGGKGKEREGRRVGCEKWGPSIVTNNLLTPINNL